MLSKVMLTPCLKRLDLIEHLLPLESKLPIPYNNHSVRFCSQLILGLPLLLFLQIFPRIMSSKNLIPFIPQHTPEIQQLPRFSSPPVLPKPIILKNSAFRNFVNPRFVENQPKTKTSALQSPRHPFRTKRWKTRSISTSQFLKNLLVDIIVRKTFPQFEER